MRSAILIIVLTIFSSSLLKSQNYRIIPAKIINGDTLASLLLNEFQVKSKMSPRMRRWYKSHERLVRNMKVVMPYAKLAAARLQKIDQEMLKIKDEKKRKIYYKEQEKILVAEFEDDIRKMTRSQGFLLIKLIDRETGKTSYSIIQDYRTNLSAAFWQGLARVFGYNLKDDYDPVKEEEMEMVIKMLGYN